jgi:hypothetical protein
MSAKGGITEGKSHKEGGIPMEVKSTGQKVELEGGEGVINKRNMASDKKFEFQGKEMTTCEIASEINSANGNGVQIDCDNVTGKKYEYATGGKILDEEQESSFKEWMDDGNVVEFEKGVYSTQDAQYRNRLKGMDELRRYFRKEFLSDSYAKGGGVFKFPIAIERKINEINNLLPKVKEADEIAGGYFGGTHYTYVQLTKPIEIKGKYVYIHSANGRYDMTFEKRYNVNDLENDISGRKGLQYDLSNILKAFKGVLKEKFKDGGWVLYDEDSERLIKVYPTESEARKNLNEYEGNANIVEKSKWDNSNKYEGGGNIEWSKAEIGDSARVKSENKMGLIIKDYGRKFHLKFADDTEKTYDASELDFYRLDEEDEFAGGGDVPKANKMFHLPLELSVYVPSTQDVDKVISDSELDARVDEVSKYLAKTFGGFTKSDKVGGFMTSQSELVTEDVVPVVSFATKDDYEANKNKLVSKLSEWARKWGQEAIGFEFEGDLYYVPQKFEGGGDVRDFEWYQMWKKDQVKKGTKHEMEHIDTIREFKKEGVSDKEVAEAIAKDHLDEDENYYIELDKMESSKKVSDAIQDFEKQKGHRKSEKKYAIGGYMGEQREPIHLKFTEDYNGVIRRKDGKYLSESLFPKNKVYKFNFLFNDGRNTALEFSNTGAYLFVPNEIINVVGFNKDAYGNGGSIQPYQSINLDSNDKSILNMLRKIEDPYTATSEQKEKLSSFKGRNVVNNLSSKMIQKIYGILFKNHNIENRIYNLYLSNIGVGNILLFAPTYLEKTMVSFDEKNDFNQIEKDIANIVTEGKRASLYNDFDLKSMNGIIHVYSNSNPEIDELCNVFYKTEKKGIALGVCEFTSRKRLDDFQRSIVVNQGSLSQNQMVMFEKSNEYFVINEGITEEGQYTLIYTMTKF